MSSYCVCQAFLILQVLVLEYFLMVIFSEHLFLIHSSPFIHFLINQNYSFTTVCCDYHLLQCILTNKTIFSVILVTLIE